MYVCGFKTYTNSLTLLYHEVESNSLNLKAEQPWLLNSKEQNAAETMPHDFLGYIIKGVQLLPASQAWNPATML